MANSNGAGAVPMILFIVFLILKLTHVISWSWWWVCAPLWVPLVVAFALGVLVSIVLFFYAACTGKNYFELVQQAQNSFKL